MIPCVLLCLSMFVSAGTALAIYLYLNRRRLVHQIIQLTFDEGNAHSLIQEVITELGQTHLQNDEASGALDPTPDYVEEALD
ncbi:hypothetical protein DdX_18228 [Ditylenchus destructor]|uniref:Uncharacterized protein n=1 Tax=Ditylenchus destructor TaxID=166010 RepID=A0AAD4MMQ2_9BILA|nr:hypothetical protein DdX_18228 [Ditylenchus destructor]